MFFIFQNATEISTQLITTNNWRYSTKVLLLPPRGKTETKALQQILTEFSQHTIFNAAIMTDTGIKGPSCLTHYYFNQSFRHITIPTELNDCFPNKLTNLNGHKFHIHAYSNKLRIAVDNGTISGIYSYEMNHVLNHLNATYDLQKITGCFSKFTRQLSPLSDLLINRLAVGPSTNLRRFDKIWLQEPYQMGVLIPSHGINNTWWFMQMWSRGGFCHIVILIITTVLYNALFLNKQGRRLLDYNVIVPLGMWQSVSNILAREGRFAARVFLASVVIFNYLLSLFVVCMITTKNIVFMPDRSIKTVPDIIQHKIPIVTQSACIMKLGKYPVGDSYTEQTTSLWEMERSAQKKAYFVEMTMQKLMLTTANNVDEEERPKYYLLDDLYVSMPAAFLLPANSPFTEIFRNTKIWSHEAALATRWAVEEVYVKKQYKFHLFPQPRIRHGKSEPVQMKIINLGYAFIILLLGIAVAVGVFCGEILIVSMRYCKRRLGGDSNAIEEDRIEP